METDSENGDRVLLSETSNIHMAVIVVMFVFSFLILAGNLLTIISVLQFTKRKNTLSLLIIALSLSEVLTMLGPNAIALYMFFDRNKEFGDLFTLCRVQAWLVIFLRIAESLVITLLALDRVFLTAMPQFYHKHWKGKLFVLFFFGIWICAAFIATLPLLWLEGFHISSDAQEIFCLFPYNSSFAKFLVFFLLCLLVICCFSLYTMFSMSSKKSFSTKHSTNKDLSSSKKQIVARDVYSSTNELSRMVALVVVIYFCCILPWLVVISLGNFAIEYPSLFGLCAIQLPLVSGFLNPLLYGILWPPYRRAYIRALKWPGTKCCNRRSSSHTRSHTLDTTLNANHSFWLSDGFEDDDAEHENAFHILFGPTSYIKPLDFNPEELQMFEQGSKFSGFSKARRGIPQQAKVKPLREPGGNHFQNILDLIDEMTEKNRKSHSEIGLSADVESGRANAEDGKHERSADNVSAKPCGHCSDLEISFAHANSSSGVPQCREHRNGSTGCCCLGKSKCYMVERKTREMDYLVSEKTMESISSGDISPQTAKTLSRVC